MGCAFGRHQKALLLQLHPKKLYPAPSPLWGHFPTLPCQFPSWNRWALLCTQRWLEQHCQRYHFQTCGFSMIILTFRGSNNALTFRLVYIPCNPFSIKTHISRAPSEHPTNIYDKSPMNQLRMGRAVLSPGFQAAQHQKSLMWPSLDVLFCSWESQSCLKKPWCFRWRQCGNTPAFSDAEQEGCSPCWWGQWWSPWGACLLMMCKSGCRIRERLGAASHGDNSIPCLAVAAPCRCELLHQKSWAKMHFMN